MPFLVPFIVPLVGGSLFAANVIVYAGTLAVSFGLSYVANKLLAKPQEGIPPSSGGTQLDIRVDADVPRSVIFGRAATAGSLVHAQTYGGIGTAANTNLIEIVAVADHPCDALEQVFVEGQEVTLGASVGDKGQEIQDAGYTAANGAKDLAIRFFDGTQVAADPWSVTNIGSHPDFPWTASMVGQGITYFRTDSWFNPQRVSGRLRWKVVVRGIKLYDPRLDTSVGGSGAHRFDDISTHAWTNNVAVIVYNILRGVYVLNASAQREFLYGVEGTTADQLPLAEWFAAMNECDVLVTTTGSLTEAQYTAGGEITVDTEPLEVIKEMLKASGGRLVEIGGIYKLYIGSPGAPVFSFTDGDLIAIEGDSFRPVLGLEDRINYITATYTSTEEDWVPKVAPPRSEATWEAEDGRRLPADLQIPMVQSGYQAQRLMQQMLFRSRQQRKHQIPLSRMAFYVEPGDVVEWTSTRNGYVAKLFEVDSVDYHPNLNVTLALTEIDPTDYDWNAGTDTLPVVVAPPVSVAPDAKTVAGFAAAPYTQTGTTGVERAGILLTWTDPADDDIIALLWQLRVVVDPTNIMAGRYPDDPALAFNRLVIINGLAPATNYEVRARFESFEGFASSWTAWTAVTTPTVNEGLTEAEVNDLLDIERARVENLAQLVGNHAQLILQQNDALLGVQDSLDDTNASGMLRIIATTAPDDALAAIEMQVRAVAGAAWATAALQLLAYANVDGTAASRIRLIADSTQIGQPGVTGGDFESLFEIGSFNDEPRIVARADIFRDDGINAKMIQAGAAATVIPLEDADQTRTFNAWNNAGAGEEFSTINFVVSGDGIVIVKLRCAMFNASTFANTSGHFIQIVDGSAAEVFRYDMPDPTVSFGAAGYVPPLEFAISTLPAGSNTLVAKLRINDTGVAGDDSATVFKIGWIITEHHKPAIQAGGAAAAAVTYRSTQSTAGTASDPTYSAVAIGTAASNRRVVLGVGYLSTANNVTAITVGGIAAERVAHRRPDGTPLVAQLWLVTVPTGTTADIVVNTSGGGVNDLVVSVWTVTSAAEAQVDAHAAGSAAAASPVSLADLEIQTGGAAIAFAYGRGRNTFAASWSGADSTTENVEADIGSSAAHYAGYSWLTTESTENDDISFTHSAVSTPAYVAIVAGSWR